MTDAFKLVGDWRMVACVVFALGTCSCAGGSTTGNGDAGVSGDAGSDGSAPMDVAEPDTGTDSASGETGMPDARLDSGSDAPEDTTDGSDDPPRLVCNYKETERGVCRDSELNDAGECREPAEYEETEITCDGVDNDCDGTVDENCPCAYKGRGVGVCGDAEIDPDTGECAEPADYESEESSCDKKDNDCDGTVDEPGEPERFYRDTDGDGYGDPSESTLACSSPSGYTDNDDDCDDSDSSIHPGAPEECGDGVDSNCSNTPDQSDPAADTWCQNNVNYADTCDEIYDRGSGQRKTCCYDDSSTYQYCRN